MLSLFSPFAYQIKCQLPLKHCVLKQALETKCLVSDQPLPPTFFVSPDTPVPQFPHLQNEYGCYADRVRSFMHSIQKSAWHIVGCWFPQFTLDEKTAGQRD